MWYFRRIKFWHFWYPILKFGFRQLLLTIQKTEVSMANVPITGITYYWYEKHIRVVEKININKIDHSYKLTTSILILFKSHRTKLKHYFVSYNYSYCRYLWLNTIRNEKYFRKTLLSFIGHNPCKWIIFKFHYIVYDLNVICLKDSISFTISGYLRQIVVLSNTMSTSMKL